MGQDSTQTWAKGLIPAIIIAAIAKLLGVSVGAILLLLFVFVAVFFVITEIISRKNERDYVRNAIKMIGDGKAKEALTLLFKAESVWKYNGASPTRKNIRKDLERLQNIISIMSKAYLILGDNVSLTEINDILRKLLELYGDKSNFNPYDNTSLKSDKEKDATILKNKLESERIKLRQLLVA